MFKDEQLMRNELKSVLDKGFTLLTGYYENEDDHFFFYLSAPDGDSQKSVYGNMQRTKTMTSREMAFAAAYFLLGTLEGRGQINLEKVTT